MSKAPENTKPTAITKNDYVALASFLAGKDSGQRILKREPHSDALRTTAELYENREYVAAYESFKPAYDRVVANMQRVLARNPEFEAKKLAQEQQKPLAVAKQNVQSMKAHAQQVMDQFDRLLKDLESKPLVRMHLKKGKGAAAVPAPIEESPPTVLNSADETRIAVHAAPPLELMIAGSRYIKAPYLPPENGVLYSVRDKAGNERIIRVIGKSPDGSLVQAESLKDGQPSKQPIQLAVESLSRQAAKGWCNLLILVAEEAKPVARSRPVNSDTSANVMMRLDSQNFGRCCADIARANIKFGTQPIKDVGDGPFRAGNYEQAFITFEQLAIGFNSAVASSRRAIADGRRALTAEKGNLSGKEIQERTAAFIRNEQLIHTAEREFSTILEGLRMYLRAEQG